MQESRLSSRYFAIMDNVSVVRVAGGDATSFLHGQLTCDVRALPLNGHSLAGWCNAQGRLLAVMDVLRQSDGFLLTVPRELAETLTARLRRFVLRAQVTVDRADDDLAVLAVAGFDPGPANTGQFVATLGVAREPVPYFRIIVRSANLADIIGSLGATATRVAPADWVCFDIAAGLPNVYPETSAEFVPQMLNLDLLGGVSFNKGCYPGQEIVARLHFRGGLKGRMVRAHVVTESGDISPGDPVYYPAEARDQTVGRIVTAGRCGASGIDVLAVVPLAALPGGTMRIGDPHNGPLLVPGEMPYSLPPT